MFCYISAGSWENYRPDKDSFPPAVVGKEYGGYPDERWVDVRRIDALEPIMDARMDACKQSGFDGIWLDNVDGYEMDTGFTITGDEQLAYNATLANDAHSRGLGAGFNNDPHQLPAMAKYFDWVLFEIDRDDIKPCYFRLSCRTLQAFRRAGKATFVLDYFKKRRKRMCHAAHSRGFNALLKDLDLTAYRLPC